MITTIALSIMLGHGSPLFQESKSGIYDAPQITCEIGAISWCIAKFDGSIDMQDDKDERIWTLRQREGMEAGPLVIVERKSCAELSDYNIRLDHSKKIELMNGEKYETTKYTITSSGCSLKFLWPANAKDKFAYKQTMLFGVLVGPDKKEQLYKIGGSSKLK